MVRLVHVQNKCTILPIFMSMLFIREPGLVNRWLQGDRKTARCISCNGCFNPGLEEGGIYCVVEKKSRKSQPKNNHFQEDERHWLTMCTLRSTKAPGIH